MLSPAVRVAAPPVLVTKALAPVPARLPTVWLKPFMSNTPVVGVAVLFTVNKVAGNWFSLLILTVPSSMVVLPL